MSNLAPSSSHHQKPSFSRWLVIGLVVLGLASVSGLAYMSSMAVKMVESGRGLETYRTFWLVEFNWLGFLVLCAAVVLALVVAGFLRLREHMQWRSLERKYGGQKR